MTDPDSIVSAPRGERAYLSHVDGLRAISVIAVVLYHFMPRLCPGGFAGVDVFFVISGYLITAQIIADLKAGTYSLAGFYTRRIKRIFPAYFVLIAFVLSTAPLLRSISECRSIGETALYSVFNAANLYFYGAVNYFDLAAHGNPLLHLWSLGVEEQFYIVVPVFIWALWRVGGRFLFHGLIALLILSFVVSVWAVGEGRAQFAFYMLPTRAWELLAGALLSQLPSVGESRCGATAAMARLVRFERQYAVAFFHVGLLLVGYSFAFIRDGASFPGWNAVPSVLGAALIIRYGGTSRGRNYLSFRPLIDIGKASYSIYLWHWPLLVFLGYRLAEIGPVVGMVASMVAGFASWRFVEMPVRQSKGFKARHAFGMLLMGSLLLALASIYFMRKEDRNGTPVYDFRGAKLWPAFDADGASGGSPYRYGAIEDGNTNVLIQIGDPTVEPTFVLWGDSYALALMGGLDRVAGEWGRAGYYINRQHNFTLNQHMGLPDYRPREEREYVLRWLEGRGDLGTVILVSRWSANIWTKQDGEEIVLICQRLHGMGKRVFLTREVVANVSGIRCLSWGLKPPEQLLTVDLATYRSVANMEAFDPVLAEVSLRGLAVDLPIDQAFLSNGVYYTGTPLESFYADASHMNLSGALQAAAFAAPRLWRSEE